MYATNAPRRRRSLAAALGLAALSSFALFAPTVARAQQADGGALVTRRVRYDAHAAMTWDGDVGAGGRVDISIFGRQRLYDSHDELTVSVGGDVTFLTFGGSNVVSTWPTATVQWNLGATEKLALYPELGFVAHIDRARWDGVYPSMGFGARYYVYRSVSLHARLGWPVALSLGATF